MPHSLSNVLVHLVFSTKRRRPQLTPDIRPDLEAYMGGILKSVGCPTLGIGVVEDHGHLLFNIARTVSLSQVVCELKAGSSRWLKQQRDELKNFAWQGGYSAFSVSQASSGPVLDYIRGQEEHHRKTTFKEELLNLLKHHGIEFDEKYLWD